MSEMQDHINQAKKLYGKPNTLRCTVFPDLAGKCFTELVWRMDRLAEFPPEADSKKNLPLLKMARFGGHLSPRMSYRNNENVTVLFGVELDYDAGEVAFDTAAGKLREAGITAFMYTSPSHTPAAPRWRILAPFSKPHTGSNLDAFRRTAITQLEQALGFEVGIESRTLSQAFYFGRVIGKPYITEIINGRCIDEIADLTQVVEVNGKPLHAQEPVDMGDSIGRIIRGESLHPELLRLSASYAAKGMRAKDIVETLRSFMLAGPDTNSERWQDRYQQLPRMVQSAVEKFALEDPRVLATNHILHEARIVWAALQAIQRGHPLDQEDEQRLGQSVQVIRQQGRVLHG